MAEIGLFESQTESLLTPAHDLAPFLGASPERWRVHSFDERTIGPAIRNPPPNDAVVFGYNAIHQSSDALRTRLRANPPVGNLLILHQLRLDSWGFLQGDFAVDVQPLPTEDIDSIGVPVERDPREESLLNWPQELVPSDGALHIPGRTVNWFQPAAKSVWRVVLEARIGNERFPVLIRTAQVVPERVVVCGVLLEWRDPAHAALLDNMLTYCALGRPDVAVVAPEDGAPQGYDPHLMVDRLRLRRSDAIVVRVPAGAAIDVGDWPLRQVRHVVVPGGDPADRLVTGAEPGSSWANSGGQLIEARGGQLSVSSWETDAQWVAMRWAAWYGGTTPNTWRKSLHGARAVLRMLAALHRLGHAGSLGLDDAASYPPDVIATYLGTRVKEGSCEETISATAAAWDVDRLLGGHALTDETRPAVRQWLIDTFNAAPERVGGRGPDSGARTIEDQLDIVRALGDAGLLARVWEHLDDQPVTTALSVTRLREAIVACEAWDGYPALPHVMEHGLEDPAVETELRDRPMLSAEFIRAAAALELASPGHAAADLDGPAARAAVETTASRSIVATLGTPDAPVASPTEVSTEAQALLLHSAVRPTSTWPVRAGADSLPAQAIQEILRETHDSRTHAITSRQDVRERDEEIERLGVALRRAAVLLGAGSIAAMALAVAWAFGTKPDFPTWVVVAGGFTASLGALGLLAWYRARKQAPATAMVGDVLGMLSLAASIALGYVAQLNVDITVLGLGALAVTVAVLFPAALVLLGRLGLAPPWGAAALKWMADRGLPVPAGALRQP